LPSSAFSRPWSTRMSRIYLTFTAPLRSCVVSEIRAQLEFRLRSRHVHQRISSTQVPRLDRNATHVRTEHFPAWVLRPSESLRSFSVAKPRNGYQYNAFRNFGNRRFWQILTRTRLGVLVTSNSHIIYVDIKLR